MTLTANPVIGSTRVVVLSPGAGVVARAGAAEFRHFGLSIVQREDTLLALAEVVRDPSARLVVSAEVGCARLPDVLDLAIAACGESVVFGVTETAEADALPTALRAGVRATVDLPLRPERLATALRDLEAAEDAAPISIGDLTIDVARHRIDWAGRAIDASPREFSVLAELARHHPRLVPLDRLAAEYNGTTTDPNAALRVVINHLRSRLAAVAGDRGSAVIETVRGLGYRLAG